MPQHPASFRHRYGPWAVVTGASDGIGLAIASQLAASGLHLILVARRESALQALAANLQAAHNIQTHVLAVDLGSDDGQKQLAAVMVAHDVGLLIAAAGFGTSGEFADSRLSEEQAMLALNVQAVLGQVHSLIPRLLARGRGGIILFSSIVAMQGVPRSAHYAATKAYIQTLAEGLHLELKPQGIDVLASAPGPVNTGFAARAQLQMEPALSADTVAAATLAALGRRMTVAPGWLSKLLHGAMFGLPRFVRAKIMQLVMRGMTPHHESRSPSPPQKSPHRRR
jgi:hypothetical protein